MAANCRLPRPATPPSIAPARGEFFQAIQEAVCDLGLIDPGDLDLTVEGYVADVFDAADVLLHRGRDGQLQHGLADGLGGKAVDARLVDHADNHLRLLWDTRFIAGNDWMLLLRLFWRRASRPVQSFAGVGAWACLP